MEMPLSASFSKCKTSTRPSPDLLITVEATVSLIRSERALPGTFEGHVSSTALVLKRTVEKLLDGLQTSNPTEYRYRMQRSNYTSDLVQLAVAQTVRSQPMLGIIELRRNRAGNGLTACGGSDVIQKTASKPLIAPNEYGHLRPTLRPRLRIREFHHRLLTARTIICPGSCEQSTELFYLGYWERIKPYVATSSGPRSVGSAAAIDRLIRLEIAAHPSEVSAPINILELTRAGARWLQNGGNCALPGVGWQQIRTVRKAG